MDMLASFGTDASKRHLWDSNLAGCVAHQENHEFVSNCRLEVHTGMIRSKPGLCKGPCGLMDKALVFGTKDCKYESCQGQICLLPAFPD